MRAGDQYPLLLAWRTKHISAGIDADYSTGDRGINLPSLRYEHRFGVNKISPISRISFRLLLAYVARSFALSLLGVDGL